ncbi:MAG: hypothetical protein ACNS60_10265 [Candidatus Cyclobacteriaceae bacterium M2_1C_046]
MKKKKLKKFTEFASGLLPHELLYLLNIQQFDDLENLNILQQTQAFVSKETDESAFSTHVDKRKYSRMMRWMQGRLEQADVDLEFEKLVNLERQLMNDDLSQEQEKELLSIIKETNQDHYYFMKRYELGLNFLNFLLVRMRHKEYKIIVEFIHRHKSHYDHCRLVYTRIQEATHDIIQQYSFNEKESRQWESWLLTIFRDPIMDGMNRYYALVRLVFLYYNYNSKEKMEALFDEIEPILISGQFYSRRILINYYGNRLLYHSKANQLDLAEKYGWLSISVKNSDYIHYVNNLTAVLLKKGKVEEALKLMHKVFPDTKHTSNFHHRTSFTAAYITCLTKTNQLREAIQHAEIFLLAHKEEILQHRWHLYFSVFFRALFLQGEYKKILSYIDKLGLIEKEKKYLHKINSTAIIEWYQKCSLYKTEKIEIKAVNDFLNEFLKSNDKKSHQSKVISELKEEVKKKIPEVVLP